MEKNVKSSYKMIVFFGIVSLCGDIVYEGARSIAGPFLFSLGATAVVVGFVSGIGEVLSYGLRFFSGYIADRKKAYWLLTIFGYGMIFFIPLLSFAHKLEIAIIFFILERIGKGIRTPARDTILSYASKNVGTGFGFGLHEFLDQIGAVLGPMIFAMLLFSNKNYSTAFNTLWIPYILLMVILFITKMKYPVPQELEKRTEEKDIQKVKNLPPIFYKYVIFTFFATSGFVNFQLISYHLKFKNLFSIAQIPLLYLIAMGIDGLTAVGIGKIYDKIKLKCLILIPLFSFLIPVFSFTESKTLVGFGIFIWAIVMGIHETIMRAAIADIIPVEKRGLSYGIFNIIYGSGIFIGGVVIGYLYQYVQKLIVPFVFIIEVISFLLFLWLIKKENKIVQ